MSENREKSKRSESAQLRGDGIVDRRCGRRFGRERRHVFRQIRGVAGHALFRKYAGSNELKMSRCERERPSLRASVFNLPPKARYVPRSRSADRVVDDSRIFGRLPVR